MKVRLAPAALADFQDIGRAIAIDNPKAAVRMIGHLRSACRDLAQFPERHRLDKATGLRRLVVGPYLIFYRVLAANVEIVRVLHGARDYAALFAGREDPDAP